MRDFGFLVVASQPELGFGWLHAGKKYCEKTDSWMLLGVVIILSCK
jgi:hypothetical protein